MNQDAQLLIFVFESSRKAYSFCDDLLKWAQEQRCAVHLKGLLFAHRSVRGRLRLERVIALPDRDTFRILAQRLAHQLRPRHSALVLYVEGSAAPLVQEMMALYEITPLETALAETARPPMLERVRAGDAGADSAGSPTRDDLTQLLGIGPRIAGALRAASIDTYQELAQARTAELRSILRRAGIGAGAVLETWPAQAACAGRQDWAALGRLWQEIRLRRDPSARTMRGG